jgi:hypothetical protein
MYTLWDPVATSEGTRYRPHLANFGAPRYVHRMIEQSIVHLSDLVKDIDQPVSVYLVHLSSLLLRSDRLRPAIRCRGVAPSTDGVDAFATRLIPQPSSGCSLWVTRLDARHHLALYTPRPVRPGW